VPLDVVDCESLLWVPFEDVVQQVDERSREPVVESGLTLEDELADRLIRRGRERRRADRQRVENDTGAPYVDCRRAKLLIEKLRRGIRRGSAGDDNEGCAWVEAAAEAEVDDLEAVVMIAKKSVEAEVPMANGSGGQIHEGRDQLSEVTPDFRLGHVVFGVQVGQKGVALEELHRDDHMRVRLCGLVVLADVRVLCRAEDGDFHPDIAEMGRITFPLLRNELQGNRPLRLGVDSSEDLRNPPLAMCWMV
jgi:hypothetical protein